MDQIGNCFLKGTLSFEGIKKFMAHEIRKSRFSVFDSN